MKAMWTVVSVGRSGAVPSHLGTAFSAFESRRWIVASGVTHSEHPLIQRRSFARCFQLLGAHFRGALTQLLVFRVELTPRVTSI